MEEAPLIRLGESELERLMAERSRKLILRAYVEARDRLPEFEPARDTFIMSERLLLLSCLPRASSPKPITCSAILHTRVSAADSSYSNYIISCVHPAAAVCVCVCVCPHMLSAECPRFIAKPRTNKSRG